MASETLVIIALGNGMPPVPRQALTWTFGQRQQAFIWSNDEPSELILTKIESQYNNFRSPCNGDDPLQNDGRFVQASMC